MAVDAASLPHEAMVTLPQERSTRILNALQEVCGENVAQLLVAERVIVKGPGWAIVSIDEADLMVEAERLKLVPVRSMSSLAMVSAWSPQKLLNIHLVDESADIVAEVEIDFDFQTVELAYGMKSIGEFKAESPASTTAMANLKRALSVRSPIKGIESPTSGAMPFASPNTDPNAKPTSFVLPGWVGEMAVRWLSQVWRMHVILHASLPNGVARPMTLNGVYMTRVVSGGGANEHWRLSLIVHESSCRCFCNAWRRNRGSDARPLGTPKRVAIAFDFCGAKKVDRYCPKHPDVPGRCFRKPGVLTDVCLRNATVQMSCRHVLTGGGASCPTQVRFPAAMCTDSFAEALLVVSRTLCDDAKSHSDDELTDMREFLDTALAETVLDAATVHSVSDEVMVERDHTVAAMLETGQYYVAPKRKHGAAVLQQRNVSQRVPAFLDEAMATHSHLLPAS